VVGLESSLAFLTTGAGVLLPLLRKRNLAEKTNEQKRIAGTVQLLYFRFLNPIEERVALTVVS